MDDFIRARTPEQKARRMAEIKAATAEQFATLPYHEVTLTTIAVALGWSRGNLYKYVATKEEIFLALFEDAFEQLIEDLDRATAAIAAGDVPDFARTVAAVSFDHPACFRYQNLLPQVVEANVPLERLVDFKRRMIPRLRRLDGVFRRCLPDASDAALFDVSHAYRYHATGLINTFDCSETTKEAMRLAGAAQPSLDLESSLADFLTRLLASYVSP